MTQLEIDEWKEIYFEKFKDDKYMLECLQSRLDYLQFMVEEDKK